MPEDKRPRPTLDINPDPLRQAPGRTPLPGSGGPQRPGNASGPQRKRGGGFLRYIFAGLIGGAAVAGAGYLALSGDLPGLALSDLQARHRVKDLEDRAVSIESRLRALSAASPASGSGPGLTSGFETSSEVRSRLDTMVDTIRGLDEQVQALFQKVQALEQRPNGGASRETVQAEIASQLAPLSSRLTSTERELESVLRTQSERQSDARTAALTLALTNLKRAISDGRPFPAELAAVENLSGTKLPVSQLSPYKDDGVASLSDLQTEFAEASKKTIEKHYGNKSGNFMGEVLSRAKSAIQIKPQDGSGDSVEAVLGRMTSALKSGDLRTALTQGAALDDPPQEMKDWFGRAQARVAADDAVRKTDQELLASLTKATTRR